MAEFIFYTFEGHTISPSNENLDSIQILGFEEGKSREEALSNLIANNPWIKDNDFSLEKIRSRKTLTKSDSENISKIVDYLYDDEERHFEESDKPNNHMFLIIKELKKLI